MANSGGYQMKKPCECCKRYLDHLDERNRNMTCFLKLMTGNFKHNTIVPNKFLRHFTRELQGTIKLQSPNGCLYDVQVRHCCNKMVLGNGWASFLDVQDIKENDCLLFRHIDKESCFEVLVFDSDGCEKIFPCAGINKFPSIRERSVDTVNISSSSEHDTTESSGSERSAGCAKASHHHPDEKAVRMVVTSSSSDESGKGTSSERESFESDEHEMRAGTNYAISSRSCLSKAQEERVIAFIQEFQPEVTVFVAIMRKSHVQPPGSYLGITREYAVAHFPLEKNTVTLQRPDSSKKWHSQLYKRKDENVYMLIRKWSDFVRDNNVQVGDIVLLYPTSSGARKSTFTVHVLRETATYSRHRRGGNGSRTVGGLNNAEMDSEVQIKEEPTDGKHASSEYSMHELSDKYQESDDSGCPQQPLLYIVPWKSHLSRSQKGIVEEKVRAIQSEVPIYVVIMRERMVFGSRPFMVELGSRYATAVDLPSRGQTVVLLHRGKIWRTKMMVSCKRRFLRGGWPQFVRDNGLRVGDICLFELKKSERKLTMAVHVISREEF